MGLTSWSSSNYLRRLSRVYDTRPFMVSSWAYRAGTVNAQWFACIGTSGSNDQRVSLNASGVDNRIEAQVRTTSQEAVTLTVDMPLTTWTHFAAAWVSTSTVEIWMNGGNKVSNSGFTLTPSNSDSVYIGVRPDNLGDGWPSSGALAEDSIWDLTGFASGDRDSLTSKLSLGGNPLNITSETGQPWTGKLIAYWPMTTTSDILDLSGNAHHLTMVGTLTQFSTHPTIDSATKHTPIRTYRPRPFAPGIAR